MCEAWLFYPSSDYLGEYDGRAAGRPSWSERSGGLRWSLWQTEQAGITFLNFLGGNPARRGR